MQEILDEAQAAKLTELATEIMRQKGQGRFVVAIVGAPGSGKSTLSEQIRAAIIENHGASCEVVPMDGFHYDNAILDQMNMRARKGSAKTFDVAGLDYLLNRLRAAPLQDIAVPVFDRELDIARAAARIIGKEVEILLVEGNYLLLNQSPWDNLRKHFDLTIKIDCPREVLEKRLMQRWLDLGLSEAASRAKVEGNDLQNADHINADSLPADLYFS